MTWTLRIPPDRLRLWRLAAEVTEKLQYRHTLQPKAIGAINFQYGAPLKPTVWMPDDGDGLSGVVQMPMRGADTETTNSP